MSTETKSTSELLAALDAAFKSVTDISDLGDSILTPQKFDAFVRQMQHQTKILPVSRFLRMEAQQTDIDRVGFVGRILRSGSGSDGASRTLSTSDFAKPATATNKLIAQELQAIASLRDRALRRNIERGGFEDTLIQLFGEAAGRDLEEYALLGDTSIAHSTDDVLSKTDGWVKLAANKLYGRQVSGGAEADFDPAADDSDGKPFPMNLFDALLEGTPKQYISDVSQWRFWVTWETLDAYRNVLQSRGTVLGDQAVTGAQAPPYKGVQVEYVPMLERAAIPSDNIDDEQVAGNITLFSHPSNLAWGVFHEVTVEREREAKERRTDFVLTVEADAHYEDENAATVAFHDLARPDES